MKPSISSCFFDMLDAYEMAKTFRAGVGSGNDYGGNGWLRQQ